MQAAAKGSAPAPAAAAAAPPTIVSPPVEKKEYTECRLQVTTRFLYRELLCCVAVVGKHHTILLLLHM